MYRCICMHIQFRHQVSGVFFHFLLKLLDCKLCPFRTYFLIMYYILSFSTFLLSIYYLLHTSPYTFFLLPLCFQAGWARSTIHKFKKLVKVTWPMNLLWISFPASLENSTYWISRKNSHVQFVSICIFARLCEAEGSWWKERVVDGWWHTESQYLQCTVFLCRCGSASLPFDFSVLCMWINSAAGVQHVWTSGEGNEPDTFGTDTVYVWLWLQVVRQNTARESNLHNK